MTDAAEPKVAAAGTEPPTRMLAVVRMKLTIAVDKRKANLLVVKTPQLLCRVPGLRRALNGPEVPLHSAVYPACSKRSIGLQAPIEIAASGIAVAELDTARGAYLKRTGVAVPWRFRKASKSAHGAPVGGHGATPG